MKYFYDTYAIISFLDGNKNYKDYFKDKEGITNYYCMMEVYYALLKRFSKEKSEEIIDSLKELVEQPIFEDIKKASEFRLEHKKKKLSYADCLGYVVAKRKKIKFLTGDKEFENMKNVEFVK